MLLKHRDTIVLRFDWSGPDEVRILSVDDSVRNLLPLGLGGDDRSLERDLAAWLCRRTAPMGRHFDLLELIERFLQKRVSDIVQYLDCADDYLKIVGNNVGVNSKNHFADVGVVQVNDAFELQILWNLKANPLMTISSLASVLGREQRTVERRVRKLREAGLLRRNGSDKCGAWEVLIED